MRYEVRLIATTESEIVIRVDCDGDQDDAVDAATRLLRDDDVIRGLDYTARPITTEFRTDGVRVIPLDADGEEATRDL